nr:ubiquitin carboxyl-terminal hydrolase 16-like [Procambarus clarkii]
MTSRVTTKDTLTVHQNGRVVDERSSESHLDTSLQGSCADILPPLSTPSMFSSPPPSIFSSTPSSLSSSPRPPSRSSTKSPSPLNAATTTTLTTSSSSTSSSAKNSPAPLRLSRSSSSNRGKNKSSSNLSPDLVEALGRTGLTDRSSRHRNGEYKLRHMQEVRLDIRLYLLVVYSHTALLHTHLFYTPTCNL